MTSKLNQASATVKKDIHTISLLVANKPGVLVRIALVFARRAFNIDSLVVSPTVNPHFSRMTITAQGNPATLDQIIKQAAKLIDVVHVGEHSSIDAVEKELALLKIHYKKSDKASLDALLKEFHVHIVDLAKDSLIIEQTGTTAELDQLEANLKKFGIIEMIRTGKVVMARGKEST